MADDPFLTTTEILAAATVLLEQNGYRRVKASAELVPPRAELRFFEDPYHIVALAVFESWDKMRDLWAGAQSELIELISKYVGKGEPKAWEGYLVLLTPGLLPSSSREEAKKIRSNTARVRKLVSTGEQLGTIEEVHRTLLPLLPLSSSGGEVEQPRDVLELLPEILAERGVPQNAVRAVVDAFTEHKPLMEYLHNWRLNQ